MTQRLDVLFIASTGHVLNVATRAGGEDPPLEALAGNGPGYPLARSASATVLDVPIHEDVVLDRATVELTDDNALALFQRESYAVKDGALVPGLASLVCSFAGGLVKITTAMTAPTPYVALGVRSGPQAPVLAQGELPAGPTFVLPQSFPLDVSAVVVFVKGFVPRAA